MVPGVLLLAVALASPSPSPSPSPETVTLAVGPQYRAGAVHRLLLGREYRDLWTTPVELELLDLRHTAGGLVPVRRVGGQQTKGLALRGADGHDYTFRGLDKDPSEILPDDLHDTVIDRIVQDQIAASHPGGAVVASAITRAAGVLTTHPRLVVMPDDPRLGDFRADFRGIAGTFEEYPRPGFAGATEIVGHEEMWSRLRSDPAERVDAREFLRARLVDLLLGDWDRHRKQWRWARVPGRRGWQPIAEDRDQAFARYEGLLLSAMRPRQPRFVAFGPDYPGIEGLTWNGWDVDRWLLTPLERPVWEETAREVQARLGDDVLEAAVAQLPEAWRRRDGERLLHALRRRRDALVAEATTFYEHLAREVDVRLTDRAELVTVEAHDDESVSVRVAEPGSAPYWSRRFQPGETEDVRLYLGGGDDRVVAHGRSGSIRVRAIGGAGDDAFEGPVRVSDHEGRTTASGVVGLDDAPYVAPPGPVRAPWIPPRDWGRRTIPLVWLSGAPDVGAFVGGGLLSHGYAFRRHPWSDRHLLRAGWATGATAARAEYEGTFRRENSGTSLSLHARYSGLEVLRFHGFGNETPSDRPDAFYRVRQQQVEIAPELTLRSGPVRIGLGPAVQLSTTRRDEDRIVGQLRPYGSEEFGQAGLVARLELDTRDRPVHASRGVSARLRARLFPAAWDARESFGTLHGEAAGHVSFGPTLAVRAGAAHASGTYPFHEAAFIGGPGTVRGLRQQRYAGDTAAWAGADLRMPVGRVTLLVPGELGIVAFADAGRVWLDGETSEEWHAGWGGGLWFAVLGRQNTVTLSVARAEGRIGLYVGSGFAF